MKGIVLLICSVAVVLLEPALLATLSSNHNGLSNGIPLVNDKVTSHRKENFESTPIAASRFKRGLSGNPNGAGYRSFNGRTNTPVLPPVRQPQVSRSSAPIPLIGNGYRRSSLGALPSIGPSSRPLFGMDSSSSSSRRNSVDSLTNHFSQLDLNKRYKPSDIEPWERQRVNTAKLDDNCYYCTAAGLSGKNTHRLARESGTMQNRGGSIDDTLDLLRPYHRNVQSRTFTDESTMKKYLDSRLRPGSSEPFGYAYHHPTTPRTSLVVNNSPTTTIGGHMIGIKAWKNPDGTLGTRDVDFQLSPRQRFEPKLNTLSTPGPVHLIDLNPPKPMQDWNPFKRERHQFELDPSGVEPGKRHRTTGFGQ